MRMSLTRQIAKLYDVRMNLSNYIETTSAKQSEMARALNVSPALVHQWVTGLRPVAIPHCRAIEDLTAGMVTRQDLRPNDWMQIWPDLAKTKRRRAQVTPP